MSFGIFTDSPGSQPVRIESAQELEDARERLREVARIAPRRDCFIYSDSGIVEIIVHADFQALRRHINPRSYSTGTALDTLRARRLNI